MQINQLKKIKNKKEDFINEQNNEINKLKENLKYVKNKINVEINE
jgi:hypothetical protein